MSRNKRARLQEWLKSGEARLHPLTYAQRELWETSPVPPADPSHHICCFIRVQGLVTLEGCLDALQRVVERQECLRTSILPGKERPVQMVRAATAANFGFRELAADQSHPEAVEELAAEIFETPFDLLQGPLYRVEAFRRAADDHLLVLSIHHAVADGWSLGVFVQEICGAYLQGLMAAAEPLPPVPLTYSDWGAAERAQWTPAELQRCGDYWKTALAGKRRLWDHAIDLSSAPGQRLQRRVSQVPSAIAGAARELARRTGATLYSALLTLFQITLWKWTGVDDLIVGSPVANRSHPRVRETMGYFSGVVPLRAQIDGAQTVVQAIEAAQSRSIEAFAHAMPFVELMKCLGESPAPGRNPIFEVRFALQNHPVPDISIPTLSARLRMRSTGTPRLDLGCEITERDDGLEIVWLHRLAHFSAEAIEDLDRRFTATLAEACQAPERAVKTL